MSSAKRRRDLGRIGQVGKLCELLAVIDGTVHTDKYWPRRASSWDAVKNALPDSASEGAQRALKAAWAEYELYVGGPSQLKKGTLVVGVTGINGLTRTAKEAKRAARKKRATPKE